MKTCNTCGETKLQNAFTRDARRGDGRSNRCSTCVKQRYQIQMARPGARAHLRSKANEKYWKDPDKFKERAKEYKRRHPEKKHERETFQKYGLTPSDYLVLLASQNGGCALCGVRPTLKRLNVDHCHTTGKVRGLLCDTHNRAIGLFGDDPHMLTRAAMYLVEAQPGVYLPLQIAA